MRKERQEKTPVFDAVKAYMQKNTIPFHVPGHKQGRGLPEFADFVGNNVLSIDLTCFPDTDNICNPRSVIREAEQLAAEAYGADRAHFLVNGTTAGIQAMIMTVCQPGDKIILPRNAHKSAIGGLIMSGANPIYIDPEINQHFGVSMGVTVEKVEDALRRHPDAKAIFIVNPNYYGTTSDLQSICQVAHKAGVPVIVDEAHGAHFKFHPDLPLSAMECGADLVASSTHKLVGSMTQSSLLLVREGLINPRRVKSVLNLSQTTSPSYVLMCSLDLARKQMALRGKELLDRTLKLAMWAREELRKIKGIQLFGDHGLVGTPGCHAFDPTKITLNVTNLGISGYEMEKILRSRYDLQVELSDLYNVILLVTIGDDEQTVRYMVDAIRDISRGKKRQNVVKYCPPLPRIPDMAVLPREAFYNETKVIPLREAQGQISAESIMAYPPGIPLICPGEVITQEIIDYVHILKQENADLQGTEDPQIEKIKVLKPALSLVEPELESATEVS